MWAPDVHKVRPSSAVAQLVTMFGLVGLFSVGVYFTGWQSKAVSIILSLRLDRVGPPIGRPGLG